MKFRDRIPSSGTLTHLRIPPERVLDLRVWLRPTKPIPNSDTRAECNLRLNVRMNVRICRRKIRFIPRNRTVDVIDGVPHLCQAVPFSWV